MNISVHMFCMIACLIALRSSMVCVFAPLQCASSIYGKLMELPAISWWITRNQAWYISTMWLPPLHLRPLHAQMFQSPACFVLMAVLLYGHIVSMPTFDRDTISSLHLTSPSKYCSHNQRRMACEGFGIQDFRYRDPANWGRRRNPHLPFQRHIAHGCIFSKSNRVLWLEPLTFVIFLD